MIRATYSDKSFIVDILIRAFDNNNSVNYAIKQGKNRQKCLQRLMEYSFETCWQFGEIYYTPDRNAVVLLFTPEKKKISLTSIWRDTSLLLYSVKPHRIAGIVHRELILRKYYPQHLMYLWYLGVEPQFQGQGVGSNVLKEVMRLADERGLPIYLETSTLINLAFYRKLHFVLFEKFNDGVPLYMLHREPKKVQAFAASSVGYAHSRACLDFHPLT
jgi:ribosomal protein S18 acetylase RimI-like enzyme